MATISVKKEIPTKFALRRADAEECFALGFKESEAVAKSIGLSDYWDAVYVDGEFAGVWGYRAENLFSTRCWAWLLTTEKSSEHKMLFLRQSLRVMDYLFSRFCEVIVVVHAKHKLAVRWLTWLGFATVETRNDFLFMAAKKESA